MEVVGAMISGAIGGLVMYFLMRGIEFERDQRKITIPRPMVPMSFKAFANKSGEKKAPRVNDDVAARVKELENS